MHMLNCRVFLYTTGKCHWYKQYSLYLNIICLIQLIFFSILNHQSSLKIVRNSWIFELLRLKKIIKEIYSPGGKYFLCRL